MKARRLRRTSAAAEGGDLTKRRVGIGRGGEIAELERGIAERGERGRVAGWSRQDGRGMIARVHESMEGDEDDAAIAAGRGG